MSYKFDGVDCLTQGVRHLYRARTVTSAPGQLWPDAFCAATSELNPGSLGAYPLP